MNDDYLFCRPSIWVRSNDGLTPETAFATRERAKAMSYIPPDGEIETIIKTKGVKMSNKRCMKCKHRAKPNGNFPIRGWCDNPASPNSQNYVYKGDTCDEYKGKRKSKAKDDIEKDNKISGR